ncbi:hypothetical protein CPB86DRAFT_701212 [Serendipita vermifera]|nr:hypothetical protein CPB86DRAFT_701212 [Serendipita vermifera]
MEERRPRGHRLCGRESALGKRDDAWECIDTRNTLESCGGCMHHYYLDGHPVDGTDCSALPGVSDVQCYSGRCLVHRCKRGWTISPSGTECLLAVETF